MPAPDDLNFKFAPSSHIEAQLTVERMEAIRKAGRRNRIKAVNGLSLQQFDDGVVLGVPVAGNSSAGNAPLGALVPYIVGGGAKIAVTTGIISVDGKNSFGSPSWFWFNYTAPANWLVPTTGGGWIVLEVNVDSSGNILNSGGVGLTGETSIYFHAGYLPDGPHPDIPYTPGSAGGVGYMVLGSFGYAAGLVTGSEVFRSPDQNVLGFYPGSTVGPTPWQFFSGGMMGSFAPGYTGLGQPAYPPMVNR
jgi:hypothetical protein